MPVTRAPRAAIASARMPPPQPTSSTFRPSSRARLSIHSRRSGLISCSGRNSPWGSHQREASWLNFSSSAGSTFIGGRSCAIHSPKKKPRRSGASSVARATLLARAGGRSAGAGRAGAARAGRRAGRAGRRRRGAAARRAFAAAEQLGVDATIRLQAGNQLLVLVAVLAQLLALAPGQRLRLAPALDLQAARIDATLREEVGDGLRALLGQFLVVLLGADTVGVADQVHFLDVRTLGVTRQLLELLLAGGCELRLVEAEQHVGRERDFLDHHRLRRRRRLRDRERLRFRSRRGR